MPIPDPRYGAGSLFARPPAAGALAYNPGMDMKSPSRLDLRARRRDILPRERMAAGEAVAERLTRLHVELGPGHVAGYWAMDGELPLHAWQLTLPPGLVYCLPVLDEPSMALKFAPWRPGDPLVANRYRIPEPVADPARLLEATEMSLIALPLTGFDKDCRRMGMGGGWYDRTLAFRLERQAPPLLVGIGFDSQECPNVPAHPWDVPCDAIVTETRTLFRPIT